MTDVLLSDINVSTINSGKLETALDRLIAPALVAINESTTLAKEMVSRLIVTATNDVRRRPSRREGFVSAAVRFMLVGDSASLLAIRVNHDHTIAMCQHFLDMTLDIERSTQLSLLGDSESLAVTGMAVSATHAGRLFVTRRTVDHALKEFLKLRSMIAEQYVKLASKKAKEASVTRVGTSYETAFSQAKLAVLTAIDRYSATRGALASYVDMWIKQALFDKANLQEGAAFDIETDNANGSRDRALALNGTRSVPLDDILLETIAGEEHTSPDKGLHTRALSRLKHLRPALILCGPSLVYSMSNAERAQMVRMST
jgi:hypothetical protein